jgi:hypothetical protein
MTDREKYLLDLNGYLVRPGVLSGAEVDGLNEAVCGHDLGTGMSFALPWSAGLAKLAVHPAALGPMTWLCGENLRLDQAYGIRQNRGDGHDLILHGGWGHPAELYSWHPINGVISGMAAATWVLSDQPAAAGGFRCVPGSHKANLPPPSDIRLDDIAIQLKLSAGDLLIFTEALWHGTLAWSAAHQRTALLYKYTPGSMAWNPAGQIRTVLLPYLDEVGETLRVLVEPPYWQDRWPGKY